MAQILSGDPRLGPLAGQGYGGPLSGGWSPDFSEADPAPLNLTPQNPMAVNWLEALHHALPEAAARSRVSQFQLGTPQPGLIHDVGYGYGGPLGGAVADMLQPPRTGEEAAMMFGMPAVGMVRAIGGGAAGERAAAITDRAQLKGVYDTMAEQMALDPKKRFQPVEGRQRVLDTDYTKPPPGMGDLPDLSKQYPRNPDPAAMLPANDRVRPLITHKDDIAQSIADMIVGSGQMEMPTRYFYHSAGPIYRAAVKAGLSHEEAMQWLKDFGDHMGATSPKTKTLENTRNATSVMAKTQAGIPWRDVVGPGSGGSSGSEVGYTIMKNSLQGGLIDRAVAGQPLNPLMNPKPATFGPNMAGNLSGVTADSHAIRLAVQTLNKLHPGKVPIEWIEPKSRSAYKKDPATLTPDMIQDTLETQMVGPKGKATEMRTEYAPVADIYHKVADILGVSPAEAQSMAWFGGGGATGLKSAPKTISEILDDRISVTAQALGKSPDEVARLLFRRKIPLMSVMGTGAGVGAAATGILSGQQQQPGT
jgi:hypothetical protein